ncbi:cyclin-like protein [Rhynchospora pubera]|uniref:Cyclin-like protein n=1 Tax=Rhynchospora pubera TaxID=906938 RepID=A0AAV8DSZ5_9POAL|nr:cyclin-like protein [Rhynchospora pubera]
MEGFPPPRRPSGAADLPPHQIQHQHHQQNQSYWYPPPPAPPAPQPPASSSYSVPSYHHQYPSHPHPHPHPPNQHWPASQPPYGPQPQPQPQPQPPPPPPPPYHAYPPGPPPPMPPRPPHPHQMPPYPPPNQPWTNQPWPPNQPHHYPGASIPQNEGEDWAARAKAWAASKSTAEGENGRPVDQANHANGEKSLPSSQNINAGVAVAAVGADPATLVSPAKQYDPYSAIYEQEVPSYSSSQGNKDILGRYDNSQDHQPLAVPPVQDQFYHQPPDPSYMVNYGHNAHAGAVGVPGHDPVTAPHMWAPPGSAGPYQPPTLPALPAQQYDISTAVHPSMPVPNYGPPNIPPAAFNAPPVASHLNAELFQGDPSAFNQVNQPKKSAVPSWLREEILKKKTTTENNISAQVGSDGNERSPEATDQKDSKSLDSNKSSVEDDEDEVEAARILAINQEIKRILTDVLLKVTDDLFDEIATKVLSEDDMTVEGTSEAASLVKSKSHGSAPSTSSNAKLQDKTSNGASRKAKAVVHDESTKGGGVLLGLSDYNTDDDGDDENASTDRIKQNLVPETNKSSFLMQKDKPSDKNLGNHEEFTELNPRREEAEGSSHSNVISNTEFEEEHLAKEELNVETEAGENTEGDVSIYRSVDGNGDVEKSKVTIDGEDGFKDKIERSKEGDKGELRDKEGKNKEEKDERIDGNNNRVNIANDKRQRNIEEDGEIGRRDDKESKLDGLKGNKREITKEEKERITERDGKEDKREKNKEEKDRKTERRDDKEDSSKDRKDRNRDEKERKAERRDDGKWSSRSKSEKNKEERVRETDKRDDKNRSRHKRSPSPRGRSRSKERSRSSREQSDNSKRRRTESNRRSMSRSPPRSRHRRDSRSPHSKHSHHRNSAYSTSDRRRSRSRTPTRRRRSRSRTPSRR